MKKFITIHLEIPVEWHTGNKADEIRKKFNCYGIMIGRSKKPKTLIYRMDFNTKEDATMLLLKYGHLRINHASTY